MSDLSLGNFYLLPKLFLFYMRLLVFPFNLHMQHTLKENGLLLSAPLILSTIIFTGLIIVLSRFIKRREEIFGASWFILGILPFLGIFKLNSDMAEHWLYFSSFGFFLIVARLRLWRSKLLLYSVILFLCTLTAQRNFVWRSDVSIYQNTLKYRPNDPKVHYNLGNAYLRRGMLDEASGEYKRALRLKPNYAYALHNLGIASERKKDISGLQFSTLAFAEEIYVDHGMYEKVLSKFVKEGRVDYLALKNDRSLLDNYLEKVAGLAPDALDSMSRKEKIAFYTNTYNALTLKVITEHYPLKSIKDIPGVWDKLKFQVAHKELTLNHIEHEILRKDFKEPRIHFALVCASKSCPKLADEPFDGKKLDEQLDRQARRFINDKTKVRLDKDKGVIYISSIFKWFKKDFGDVVGFIGKYLSKNDAEFIKNKKPRVRYLEYDWSLND